MSMSAYTQMHWVLLMEAAIGESQFQVYYEGRILPVTFITLITCGFERAREDLFSVGDQAAFEAGCHLVVKSMGLKSS